MRTLILLSIVLSDLAAPPAYSAEEFDEELPRRHARELEEYIEQDPNRLNVLTDMAVEAMLDVAKSALIDYGFQATAESLEKDFEFYQDYFRQVDLGDYEPMSAWLAYVSEVLYLLLGQTTMELLHLDDIHILNYALPVALNPENPKWDKAEYQKHFVPFAGVITYWTMWSACTAASVGSGTFVICTPSGMLAERVMTKRIAPRLSDRVYDWRNI